MRKIFLISLFFTLFFNPQVIKADDCTWDGVRNRQFGCDDSGCLNNGGDGYVFCGATEYFKVTECHDNGLLEDDYWDSCHEMYCGSWGDYKERYIQNTMDPVPTYSNGTSRDACWKWNCKESYYATLNSLSIITSCTACAPGYSNSTTNNVGIASCKVNIPAGKGVASVGAAPTNCVSGTYRADNVEINQTQTRPCDSCKLSPGTEYTASDGTKSARTDCYLTTMAGKYVATARSNQVPCPAGKYCAGGTKVYYGSTGATPTTCPAGNYCPESSSSPISCPAGKYCLGSAAASSGDCAAGYYCPEGSKNEKGLTDIEHPCPVDHYCESGSSAPTLCPDGKHSPANSVNSAACTACAVGYYCPAGSKDSYGCIGSGSCVADCETHNGTETGCKHRCPKGGYSYAGAVPEFVAGSTTERKPASSVCFIAGQDRSAQNTNKLAPEVPVSGTKTGRVNICDTQVPPNCFILPHDVHYKGQG